MWLADGKPSALFMGKGECLMFDKLLKTRWSIILVGTFVVTAPLIGLAIFVYVTVTNELTRLSSEQQLAFAYRPCRYGKPYPGDRSRSGRFYIQAV